MEQDYSRLSPDIIWSGTDALGHALEWAVAHGQTPDRLHAALAAYRDLPKMASATDMVRVEANLVENTLDLPTSRLRDWVFESMNGDFHSEKAVTSPYSTWRRCHGNVFAPGGSIDSSPRQ